MQVSMFKGGEINISFADCESDWFTPGQTVNGFLEISAKKVFEAKELVLSLVCVEHHQFYSHNGTHGQTNNVDEEVFCLDFQVPHDTINEQNQVRIGQHKLPFQISIPENLNPSFMNGAFGPLMLAYYIRAQYIPINNKHWNKYYGCSKFAQ